MRRYLGHIAAAVVLVAFLAAGAYSFVRMTAQFGLFMDHFRTGNWIATQANVEYLRLTETISSYQADPSAEARSDMLTRLDLFWSRLPLVLEGEEGKKIRSLPGAAASIQAIIADLPQLERRLQALSGRDLAAYRDAMAHADSYRAPLRDLLQALLAHDGETISSTAIDRQRGELFVAFGFVGLAGAALFILLSRSLRSAQQAYDKARSAEANALLAREQLEDAIESIGEGFVLYDKDERLIIANSPYKSFYPTIADMVQPGARLEDILRTSATRCQYQGVADPQAWTRERLEQHRNPKGSLIQHLVDGRILRVSDRRTRSGGIVSVRADITDLVRAEELLTKRLAAIEAAPDGIAIVDPSGALQYVNRSLATLYGEKPEAMVGRAWPRLFALADQTLVPRKVAEAIAANRPWRSGALGRRADGTTFPMEVGLSAAGDGGLVLALRNVEHEMALKQQHARLEHQFHQAQKMEAIGRLAGGIAHDFNNILAAICGYASFLAEDLAPGTPQAGFAANISTAAGHAKKLVQQILAFSRSQDIERLPVDPKLALKETAEILRPTLPPTTRVVVRDSLHPCMVWANPTQISQVLMNLCVNANDALDGRAGQIVLALEGPIAPPDRFGASTRGTQEAFTEVAVERVGGGSKTHATAGGPPRHSRYVLLTVADDGSGMPPGVMERMFDPFFTTKKVGKGTGLGLAAVHGIVLSHGGLIEAESGQGEGTTFHIYLPVYEADSAEAPLEALHGQPRGKERVLVVDDQEMVGTMLATNLERLGYDVTLCASSEDALEAINEAPFAWDLLLSDIRMPGVGGIELARSARAVHPNMPIVLCSGYSDMEAESKARDLDVTIVPKPVDRALLARALREALGAREAASKAA
ncbi:MAG: PAS-domain containing protein [Rhodospirillales bacterium]|nr:PAS-domain containing protein [Rhodospirillales bacterium]